MATIGFLPRRRAGLNLNAPCNASASNMQLVKAALCAGLYANVLLVSNPQQK